MFVVWNVSFQLRNLKAFVMCTWLHTLCPITCVNPVFMISWWWWYHTLGVLGCGHVCKFSVGWEWEQLVLMLILDSCRGVRYHELNVLRAGMVSVIWSPLLSGLCYFSLLIIDHTWERLLEGQREKENSERK